MRDSNVSFGSLLKSSLRMLDDYRPSQTLCTKTGTDIETAFSESQLERANGFKESIQSMRGGNPLLTFLETKSLSDFLDYVMPLIQYIAPWPILFLISILTFFVICCNWCCIYGCCKNGKCCKCCKAPKDSKRKRIYVALSVLFLLGALGSSIAGVIVSTQVATGLELTLCSVISVVEDLEYGLLADKWIGVKGAAQKVQQVSDNYDAAMASLSSSASASALTELNDVKTSLTNYVTNVQSISPKPSRAAPDQASTYDPIYLTYIGPPTDNTTYTGLIQAECQTKYDVAEYAKSQIDTAVSQLNTQTTTIKSGIDSALSGVNEFSNQLQDMLKKVGDYGGIGRDATRGVGSGLTGVFIANLVVSVFTIGAIVMVGCMKVKFFNKFLLSNSFVMIGLTILGWLLTTIFYPTSLVLMEVCDVIDKVVNDQGVMYRIMNNTIDNEDITQTIDVCFFQTNSNMADKFKLSDYLKDFDTIIDQLNNITSANITLGSSPPSIFIPMQEDYISKWSSGLDTDSVETTTDLTALNQAVNSQNNPCTFVADTWQLNVASCTSSMGDQFASSDADRKGLSSSSATPVCLGLDTSSWSSTSPLHDINNRYTIAEFPGSCSTRGSTNLPALSYVQQFIPKFQANRAQVKTYFNAVTGHLADVKTKYQTFADKLKTYLDPVNNVNTQLQSILDVLRGSDGLIENMDCKFIKTDIDRVQKSLCIGFIASIYQSAVVIIITSVMTFLSSIFVFCLGKRFILDDPADTKKPKPV